MVGKSKSATRTEKRRMEMIKGLGCIACLVGNWPDMQCEIHHVVDGGKRLGHEHTFSLCTWHHRGIPPEGSTGQEMTDMLGPSLANGSKPFSDSFGSQTLLVAVQDYLLDRFDAEPWLELSMPREVVLDTVHFWRDLRLAE